MVYHVTYWDLLLGPIYILIFYLLAVRISKKHYSNDDYLRKKLLQGFWLKILFAVLYILITQFYYGGSDGFMYYEFGTVIHRAVVNDVSNLNFLFGGSEPFFDYVSANTFDDVYSVAGYMFSISNQIVSRISCFFGFFCFQNYSVISLFFSMLSYIGIWKMYIVFYKVFPQFKKQVSISFLCLPSFLFWGSGLMKEPLCLLGLGFIISGFYKSFFLNQSRFSNFFAALLACYFLYLVKNYIFFAFMASFILMMYSLYTKKINLFLKFIFAGLILGGIAIGFNLIVSGIQNDASSITSTDEFLEQTKNFKNNYEDMGGAFVDIGDFEPTVAGISKKIPQVIVNVFFRPFPWEARSLVLVISMFESLFFLVLIIRAMIKTEIYNFFIIIFKNPVYLSCFVFSLFLGIIVGLTTFNFGTIVRYKLPCMPFFSMILLFLNLDNKKRMPQA
jgi:hypothetical protein